MAPLGWEGKTIGTRYQIETLLGQGGMSSVYRAFDPNLRRTVAIKLIHPHMSTDPNFIGRFKEEAAAVARLRHPNIVQVHDFDMDGETYFMVMEYLVGETLQTRLRRLNSSGRRMPYSDAISICTQICDAAGYAHHRELIHRDIKPANIMLDVNGQAILMDFGIVKIIGGEYHTATGATLGTAMYMSPEQIRGERADDRSDIYSLGVTLYEMLSGRPPYQAESAITVMMMVLNDPLPDLRELRQDIPEELLAIVNQALAKQPSERFQSMAEMAAALQQAQGNIANLPSPSTVVDANPAKPSQTPNKASWGTATVQDGLPEPVRKEIASAGQPGVIPTDQDIPVAEVVIPATPATQDIPVKPTASQIKTTKPEAKSTSRLGSLRMPGIIAGILILLAGIGAIAVYLSSKQPPSLSLTPITYSHIPVNAQTAQGVVNLGLWSTDSNVIDLDFSPDGALLGTAHNRDWVRFSKYHYYSGLWQVEAGNLQRYLLGHEAWVAAVAFSPDGQHFATASDDTSLIIWQVQGGSQERKIEASIGGLTSVEYSPNGLLLAAGSWDGRVGLWQVSNGNSLRSMQEQEYAIKDVAFSPDSSLIAAASDDGSILIWKVSDGNLSKTLRSHSAAVEGVVFSPDGTLLASASVDHTAGLWNMSDGTLLHSLEGHKETVKDIAFSPDGSLLVTGSEDGTLCLWQVSDGQLLRTLSEEDSILSIAFSPDGYYLVAGIANGNLRFWGISEAIQPELSITPDSP